MKKISFDFDSTLDRDDVQSFAKELINEGVEVWIITSRFSPEQAIKKWANKSWNNDLFEVADKLGISRDHIAFTAMQNKSEFIKNKDFIFHLDDDWVENEFINEETKTIGISHFGNKNWKNDCRETLK